MDNINVRLANKEYGPIALKINDENKLEYLKNIILDYWPRNDKKKDYFPAPQPVSLERRDLNNLITNDYYVCVKSDGMRFLMLCHSGNIYFIDRAFKFYQINYNINNNILYNKKEDLENITGGIYDGELVRNVKNKWQYVVHDCICSCTMNMSYDNFPSRYKEIIKLVEEISTFDSSVCEIRITSKQFFPFKKLKDLNKLINENKLDHITDGLIFTPKDKKIGTGTQFDLYKWKPRNLHTFDFKILIYNNIINLTEEEKKLNDNDIIKKYGRIPGKIAAYVNNNGKHELYASCPPGDKSELLFLNNLNINCPGFINGNIVECEYNEDDESFKPIKIRFDKTHPNSNFTVKKTLSNIKENITINELIHMTI